MIGREKRVLLRHCLEQGLSKTAIARELGIQRRTVYHWIEPEQLDRTVDELPILRCRRRPINPTSVHEPGPFRRLGLPESMWRPGSREGGPQPRIGR